MELISFNNRVMEMIKVGIIGGSGYGGSEMLRLLLFHPQVEINLVTTNQNPGKRVDAVHPKLSKITDLTFASTSETPDYANLDCVFLALPHGQAMEIATQIPSSTKVIDLSGDFRLNDAEIFRQFYGQEHKAMAAQSDFVCGLTEVNRNQIKE